MKVMNGKRRKIMDKLKMQSENLVDENIEKIAKLFPNCVTEGKNENGQASLGGICFGNQ